MPLDSRITLHKLEVFDLVVELGSVSRTADHLFVSQPVVTAHIRSLEERVGARLFYREGRQLVLTEAGRVAHSWARDVLTHTRELSRHLDGLSDGSRGGVVVGASMSTGSYLLPPILTRFRQQRPLAEIKCYVSDSEHAMEGVEGGQNDFAVVILETGPVREGLEAEKLHEEEFVVAAAPDFELPESEITLAQLATLPMVESPTGLVRRTLVDRQLGKLGIRERNVVIELGHPEAMKRAAQSGLGVTLQFRSAVAQDVEAGRLRTVEIADANLSVPVFLISRKGKFLSAIQQDLMDDIRREIGGHGERAA
jgi:LysR family transcriptional regulator, low CO2-responsive transcriptional regulator